MRGFTLTELMITLAIAAIVMTLGVPSFTDMIKNNRVISQTNNFVTALNIARSEAIKRGTSVTLCSSSSQTSCGGGWHNGWIIFIDTNSNGALDGGETVSQTQEALGGTVTLRGSANVASRLTYLATGFASLPAASTFSLCDDRGTSKGKSIAIAVTGRITTTPTPASCTP